MLKFIFLCLYGVGLFASSIAFTKPNIPQFIKLYSTDGSYEEVRDNLLLAIEDRGMVLSYHAHIGEMLERTGKSLDYESTPYKHADVFGFCKADLSNMTLRENEHFISLCPFAISIYQLANEKAIYLAYRAFPQDIKNDSAWHAVEKLLQELIAETGAQKVIR